jgi:hypothetical protein
VSASLCLLFGALVVTLPTDRLTLAWTHSVQKTPWEEDYRLEEGALRLAEARIQGSGAGMEVPPGAVLRDGIYHYRPALDRLPELRLALSHYTWFLPSAPAALRAGVSRVTRARGDARAEEGPMCPDSSGYGERLRQMIDSGRTGDKIPVCDPAAAPFESDAEASGHPTGERLLAREAAARHAEAHRVAGAPPGHAHPNSGLKQPQSGLPWLLVWTMIIIGAFAIVVGALQF